MYQNLNIQSIIAGAILSFILTFALLHLVIGGNISEIVNGWVAGLYVVVAVIVLREMI